MHKRNPQCDYAFNLQNLPLKNVEISGGSKSMKFKSIETQLQIWHSYKRKKCA